MIGIVGGVGPQAGLDVMKKIIEETRAIRDQDHLPVLLSSQPHRIADRTDYLLDRGSDNPAFALADIILELAKAGAKVTAIPCNTAHAPGIFDVIRSQLHRAECKIKLLHLVDETVKHIKTAYGDCRVGVLSTTGTRNTGLYRNLLLSNGLTPLEPDDMMQEKVHQAIYDEEFGIKALSSPVTKRAKELLTAATEALRRSGANVIVLGCTELPLALNDEDGLGVPLIDPNRILARALIRETDPDKLKSTSPSDGL